MRKFNIQNFIYRALAQKREFYRSDRLAAQVLTRYLRRSNVFALKFMASSGSSSFISICPITRQNTPEVTRGEGKRGAAQALAQRDIA